MSFRPFNRRDFIAGVGAASSLALPNFARAVVAIDPTAVFAWGVASGDPLADRVIIWTRVSPSLGANVAVLWDVALDAGFKNMVRRGRAVASAASDHTVKVDVLGLPANTPLFFRFVAGGQTSSTGNTRTLPVGQVDEVKLAVFSCSNYPAGYFNAYAEAAKLSGIHAALHIGDYIYEYARGGYASQDAATMNREVQPATELLALTDYRQRYAQYRTDPDLQALHAAMPWICVWDDHEIANDTWKAGAENHQPATEGDFFVRRDAAVKAYHEWLPTRPPVADQPLVTYRSFKFGNLVDLHMLDTRLIARDQQLNYANYATATGFDTAKFTADMSNPTRQMMGTAQMNWLTTRMASTTGVWTLLGQQVLMGRMNIPAPLVLGQVSFTAYSTMLYKAQVAPSTLTAQEQAILAQPAIPYNLDAWDGYAVAREALLGTARALNKNLVVLAGDTHNAWASDLADYAGRQVGVEFATPGVTSPGLETYFPTENPVQVAAGLEQIIAPLVYAETSNRGFMVITATATECRSEWYFVSTIKSRDYTATIGKRLRTLPGAGNRTVVPA
jgi:alkaline phosphatase D